MAKYTVGQYSDYYYESRLGKPEEYLDAPEYVVQKDIIVNFDTDEITVVAERIVPTDFCKPKKEAA